MTLSWWCVDWPGNLQGVKRAPIKTGDDKLDERVVYSCHIYGPEGEASGTRATLHVPGPMLPEHLAGTSEREKE